MIASVDGYICEIPEEAAILEFHSGKGEAGVLVARNEAGEKLETKHIGATFNLKERPWWERLADEVQV